MFYAMVQGQPALATKTGQRAQCPGCAGEVIAKCGPVITNHWAHKNDDCGFESDEHLTLKLLFAFPSGGIEVYERKIKRRADVMIGRSVFEIQRSKIDADEVRARDDDWQSVGCSVYWVIVDGFDVFVPSPNAVTARMLNDGRVEMWCPGMDREAFNPYKTGRSASAMAMDMLARRKVARALATTAELEDIAAAKEAAAEAAEADRRAAVEQTTEAKQQAAEAHRKRREIEDQINHDARARARDEAAIAAAAKAATASAEQQRIQDLRQLAEWIQERTGVRGLARLRRRARFEPAAAAVVAAIDYRTEQAFGAALGDITPATVDKVCRQLKDLCCVWVGPGRGGKIYACELSSGERTTHDTIAQAALWCVRSIPAGAGLEAS